MTIWASWSLLCLVIAALVPGPMQKEILRVPGRVVHVADGDLDGDGLRELLVFWRQGLPPRSRARLSVFPARVDGLGSKPVQVISLPETTVAFDVGDGDGDGRADVLLLAADGVWSLSGQADGKLRTEPRALVKVMTVAAFPHEDRCPPMRLLIPLPDGGQGFLVPTVPIGPMTLYAHRGRGVYEKAQVLRVPLRANLYTAEEDRRSARDFSASFRFSYPRFQLADQDGDGRQDLWFFREDVVAIFRARKNGGYPGEPDIYRAFGLLTGKERVNHGVYVRGQAGDVNGDGRADLLLNKNRGGIANMRSSLRLFLSRPGEGGFEDKPALVLDTEGYGASVKLVDVNGDGRDDLLRPSVEVGVMAISRILLSGKLDVPFLVHLSKDGLKPKADFRLETSLGVNLHSAQEMTGSYPMLDQDFNGDGRQDALLGYSGQGSGKQSDRIAILLSSRDGVYQETWGLNLSATRFVQPYRPKIEAPVGLVIYFPMVEGQRGDVWVLTNRGGWPKVN